MAEKLDHGPKDGADDESADLTIEGIERTAKMCSSFFAVRLNFLISRVRELEADNLELCGIAQAADAQRRALESASQPGSGEAEMAAWVELWEASREAYNATYAETRFQKRSHVKEVADRAEAAGERLRAAMESTREAVIETRESIDTLRAAPSAGNGEAKGDGNG